MIENIPTVYYITIVPKMSSYDHTMTWSDLYLLSFEIGQVEIDHKNETYNFNITNVWSKNEPSGYDEEGWSGTKTVSVLI